MSTCDDEAWLEQASTFDFNSDKTSSITLAKSEIADLRLVSRGDRNQVELKGKPISVGEEVPSSNGLHSNLFGEFLDELAARRAELLRQTSSNPLRRM